MTGGRGEQEGPALAPQPPGPPSGLLVWAPHPARRPASPGRCTFAGDSLIQQTAVLLGGQARRQTTHKQRDAWGQRPALSHVEPCLAHLPQGHLQGGDTERSPGDTPTRSVHRGPKGRRPRPSALRTGKDRRGGTHRDLGGQCGLGVLRADSLSTRDRLCPKASGSPGASGRIH